ncbi:protein with RING finger domain at C-terminus [Cryptosporidium felis]|nr:protein with RING finger domain at C-terminus [Cryptosporidium felis]
MLYNIKVQDGELGIEKKDSSSIELFKYEFCHELLELLHGYEIASINICENYIVAATLDNFIIFFRKNLEFKKVGKFKINIRSDGIFKRLRFCEAKNVLHLLSSKAEYMIVGVDISSRNLHPKNLFQESGIAQFSFEQQGCKVLLVLNSGHHKLLVIKNLEIEAKQVDIFEQVKVKNDGSVNRINVIWDFNGEAALWNIGLKIHYYDFEKRKSLLKINLKSNLTLEEKAWENKIFLYSNSNNLYILIKNKVFLCKITKDDKNGEDRYSYKIILIHKLATLYSIIDVSSISVLPFNSAFTCIMTIMSNSKDQLNIFIFDSFFRPVRHNIIHCRKQVLKESKRNKYLRETEYINLEHLQKVPRFLKFDSTQILIHKNRNQSFLRMESLGAEDIFRFCIKDDLVNESIFLLDCGISKEMEFCYLLKFMERNPSPDSIQKIDFMLSRLRASTIGNNPKEEFDLFAELFKYFGRFEDFIYYIKESEYFLLLFMSIQDLFWYSNFVTGLFKENIVLFYHVISNLPIKEIYLKLDFSNKVYSGLLYYMESNVNIDLRRFSRISCSHENEKLTKNSEVERVYYYLSYIVVLSWIKFSRIQTLKSYLHLLQEFPNNEVIQELIIFYFNQYCSSVDGNTKKILSESISCILSTDDPQIISTLIISQINGDYDYYFNLVEKRKDSFVFIKELVRFHQNNQLIDYDFDENRLSEFFLGHINHISELYLEFSKHLLLDHILQNHNLLNLKMHQELIASYANFPDNDINQSLEFDRKFLLEAESIILFLLNEKVESVKLLLSNGLVFSCLSLLLFFSPEDDDMWKIFVDMIVHSKQDIGEQVLDELYYWLEYFIYSNFQTYSSEKQEESVLNIFSNFTFSKSQYYFKILRRNKKTSVEIPNNCCNWHNIPFCDKFITKEMGNKIMKVIYVLNESNEGNENSLISNTRDNNLHENYIKLQLGLACSNYDFLHQEINNKIQNYIQGISSSSVMNLESELCLLCNSKLFLVNNQKITNKVVLNHCRHNYHYECFLKFAHVNEKSHKLKADYEYNIYKGTIKCIYCQNYGIIKPL